MEKIKKHSDDGFAFLGSSWKRFILILIFLIATLTVEKVLSYQYLILQKSVQEGNLSLWHPYLKKGFAIAFVSIITEVFIIFSQLWIGKTQKVNFFRRYKDTIQQEGHFKICQLQLDYGNAKINTIIETITAIISITYTFFMFEIVEMNLPIKIGAAMIFFSGVFLGVIRGNLQQKTDTIGAEINAKQQLLTNFYMVSDNVLNSRLKDIDRKYWLQIICQVIKNFIKLLPKLIQVVCFLAFMWTVTASSVGEGETVYSYSFIIITAYGYVVSLANDIGNIVEDVSKLYKYSKSDDINLLDNEEEQKGKLLRELGCAVKIEDGITITKRFWADVTRPDGEEAYYSLPNELKISRGEMILLEGQNGTGKSRFNQLLKEIVPESISYNTRTNMTNIFIDNFRGKFKFDFTLMRRLANGLGLKRIPNTNEGIKNLILDKQINGADRQLLLALQILYFAIKEHEEDASKIQLIILDEIMGNISEENSTKVINFLKAELEKIGACTILVTHSHKSTAQKVVNQVWEMVNDQDKILIQLSTTN